MELDVLENKTVELLSRLERSTIIALTARGDPNDKELVTVDGKFEDEARRLSNFQV